MAVTIIPRFNRQQVIQMLKAQKQRIEERIIFEMQVVGEAFVANARNNGAYNDHTGNLRSSVGYIILRDGVPLSESFPGDKEAGVAAGKAASEDAASRFPSGIVLIVVAGMDYAFAVETGYRGDTEEGDPKFVTPKDVLSGSGLIAESQLREALAAVAKPTT